ncbi:MAG: hypothetical protein HRT58_14635 [Crocinitomicaceae bacterium]|nr:hypothetical protein [Flavobacteriales bacterium]NQZ36904.1 hypothetical protein [Crocinitomicaceae bacterium]
MKKGIGFFIALGVLTFSLTNCTVSAEDISIDENDTEANVDSSETEEGDKSKEVGELPTVEEGKVYTVSELYELFDGVESQMAGTPITVEGYYLNYNKSKNQYSGDWNYNLTLYPTDECEFKSDRISIKMVTKDLENYKSTKQRSKLVIKGIFDGLDGFDRPQLYKGSVVK